MTSPNHHPPATWPVQVCSGSVPAASRVLDAAAQVAAADPDRYPLLTAAVHAYHQEQASLITEEAFFAKMLELAPTARPADALRRSRITVLHLLTEATAYEVVDVRNAGPHCVAVWYLTCKAFGVEPPWGAGVKTDPQILQQLDYERARLNGWRVPGEQAAPVRTGAEAGA